MQTDFSAWQKHRLHMAGLPSASHESPHAVNRLILQQSSRLASSRSCGIYRRMAFRPRNTMHHPTTPSHYQAEPGLGDSSQSPYDKDATMLLLSRLHNDKPHCSSCCEDARHNAAPHKFVAHAAQQLW